MSDLFFSEKSGIFFPGNSSGPSENNIIEECEVSDFAGGNNLFAGIALWGGAAVPTKDNIIRNNRISDNSHYANFVAIVPGTEGSLIEGNTVENVNQGFYGESDCHNIMITHNRFNRVGIVWNWNPNVSAGVTHDIVFSFNDITMTNLNYIENNPLIAFNFLKYNPDPSAILYSNIVIFGNVIASVATPSSSPPTFQYLFDANSVVGLTIANNFISRDFVHYNTINCQNVNMYLNWDSCGAFFNTYNTGVALPGTFTGTFNGTLSGNATTATSFTGSLAGGVVGTQGATVVNSVGGQSAANVAAGASAANAATSANTPNTIMKRDASGNFSAGTISASLSGNANTATTAANFTGSLAGDVGGPQGTTVVNTVGGQSSANVASGVGAANAATTANTPNTIVKRDALGNFSAGTITANLSGNADTATTASNIIGSAVFTAPVQNYWPGSIMVLGDDLSCSLGTNYFSNTAGIVTNGSYLNGNNGAPVSYTKNTIGWPSQLATGLLGGIVTVDNACAFPNQRLVEIATLAGQHSPPYDGITPELNYIQRKSPNVTGIPQLAIVFDGMGDVFTGQSINAMWSNLTNIVSTLKSFGCKVAVCTIPLNGWCFSSGNTLSSAGSVVVSFDSMITNNSNLFDTVIDLHSWAAANGYEAFNASLYIDGSRFTTLFNSYISQFIYSSIVSAKLKFPSAQNIQISSWTNQIPIQAMQDVLLSPVNGFNIGIWNGSYAVSVPANNVCYFTPAPTHGTQMTLSLNIMLPPKTTNNTSQIGYWEYSATGASLHGMGFIGLTNSTSIATNFVLQRTGGLTYSNATSIFPWFTPGSDGAVYLGPLIFSQK